MKIKRFIRIGVALLAAAAALTLGAPESRAQSVSLPPAIKAKIGAWMKWFTDHNNCIKLGDLLAQVGETDRDPDTTLNKKQSGQLLAIFHKWQPKHELSEDEAKTVQKEIGAILTEKQIRKIATIERPSQKMMKAGMAAQKAGKMPKDASAIPDPPKGSFNPLDPETMMGPNKNALKKIMGDWEASLSKRAKGA